MCVQQLRDDCRRCSPQARPSTSFVDNAIDLQWRIFQSLGESSRGKYLYFLEIPNVLITQCEIGRRKLPRQNQLDSSSQFHTTSASGGLTDGRTDRLAYDDNIWLRPSRTKTRQNESPAERSPDRTKSRQNDNPSERKPNRTKSPI